MRITLTIEKGRHAGRVFKFERHDTFIVGRAGYAHLRLGANDKYFSRAHFLIELNPPYCRLIDMGSTNGTFVNGERIVERDLAHGDQIEAGKTVIGVSITRNLDSPEKTSASEPSRSITAQPIDRSKSSMAQPTPSAIPQGRGENLGRVADFELVRELGRGGMGLVYLAIRQSDGRKVALKTIHPKVPVTSRDIDRFVRESAILKSLDHPAIVRFLDCGESNGQVYLAMEFIDGIDLATLIKRSGPLPVDRAAQITCRLLEGLQYAHDRRFVHRDIKPANILGIAASGDEGIKLADFGLARVYQESKLSGLTLQGDIGGTIAFAAPEQITQFRETLPASDQYSAAATLYMLLTGRCIYDFPAALNGQVLMVIQEDPIPIQSRRPDLPDDLSKIIHRALNRDPASRYPDVSSMRKALLPFRKQA